MRGFEEKRIEMSRGVTSTDLREKLDVQEKISEPGFYDGLTEDQGFVLRRIAGDLSSTIFEVELKQTKEQVALRAICARARVLRETSAWTKEKFDSMVQEILELGDSDSLEPLFMLAPPDFGREWVEARIIRRGKPVTL